MHNNRLLTFTNTLRLVYTQLPSRCISHYNNEWLLLKSTMFYYIITSLLYLFM
jgi:hypothetical protein